MEPIDCPSSNWSSCPKVRTESEVESYQHSPRKQLAPVFLAHPGRGRPPGFHLTAFPAPSGSNGKTLPTQKHLTGTFTVRVVSTLEISTSSSSSYWFRIPSRIPNLSIDCIF